jgi:hypothetical protein
MAFAVRTIWTCASGGVALRWTVRYGVRRAKNSGMHWGKGRGGLREPQESESPPSASHDAKLQSGPPVRPDIVRYESCASFSANQRLLWGAPILQQGRPGIRLAGGRAQAVGGGVQGTMLIDTRPRCSGQNVFAPWRLSVPAEGGRRLTPH